MNDTGSSKTSHLSARKRKSEHAHASQQAPVFQDLPWPTSIILELSASFSIFQYHPVSFRVFLPLPGSTSIFLELSAAFSIFHNPSVTFRVFILLSGSSSYLQDLASTTSIYQHRGTKRMRSLVWKRENLTC